MKPDATLDDLQNALFRKTTRHRIYISSHKREDAQVLSYAINEDTPYVVVSTWHSDPDPKLDPWRNWVEIRNCDALVLIGGKDPVPGGKFFEAGIAYALGKRVINYGPFGNKLCQFSLRQATTLDELVKCIEE